MKKQLSTDGSELASGAKRNTGWRHLAIGAAAALLSVTLLAGCSSSSGGDRVVIEKPDKEITVITDKQEPVAEPIEVERIDKLDGIRGMDWLSDTEIVETRENKDRPLISIEGEKKAPLNLFAYDLATGKDRLLVQDEDNKQATFAVLSQSRTYMFYIMNIEEDTYSYIMNLQTGEKKQVTDALVPLQDGTWDGDDTIVFAGLPGQVFAAHPNRDTEKLLSVSGNARFPVLFKGLLYYTDEKLNAKVYSPKDGTTTTLAEKVEQIFPSPDGTRLALVKMTGDTERTLVITDLKGNVLQTLSKGTQIFGTAWSPDGSKLAYNLINEGDNGTKGIIVADAATGKTTFAAIDVPYAGNLKWNPSGDKFVASTFVSGDQGGRFVTYVVTLK